MKPELLNLLDRLTAQGESGNPSTEQFSSLIVFPNGRALAIYRHGTIPFRNLHELEHFAYTGSLPGPKEPTYATAAQVGSVPVWQRPPRAPLPETPEPSSQPQTP